MIKSKISTQVLAFFMKQNSMYMTTSRVDDYPTSMNSHGTEAMKAVQSAPYQVFRGTNYSTDRFYRYKKVSKIIAYSQESQDKKVVCQLKYISMQGGFVELKMEQIRNSQEDNQTDRNTQIKFINTNIQNYNSDICKLHTYVQCNISIIVLQFQCFIINCAVR